MNYDLEYDYAEALKRQGHSQADVDALRNILNQHAIVPKSITNKQVSSWAEKKVRRIHIW